MASVRIENDSVMAHFTRVVHIADDGTETDISSVCQDIKLHLHVGDANRATVQLIKVQADVLSELSEVAVKELRRAKVPWLRRIRDVTTFNRDGCIRYVR